MATSSNPTSRSRAKSGTTDNSTAAGRRAGFREQVRQQKERDANEGRMSRGTKNNTKMDSTLRRLATEQNSRVGRGPNQASNPGRLSAPTRDSKPTGTRRRPRGGK